WTLEYLLRAADDPSLLVEAETVWKAKGDRLDYLKHRFERPQERLLAALGMASRVFAPVERSLRARKPTGVTLSRDEAYTFLVEAAPVLETSGFAVLVPNWWGRRARLKARARLRAQAEEPTGVLTFERLVKYKWELSLGDNPISKEEFEQLAALKQPLVRYQGEWVTLDPEQAEAALRFFEKAQAAEGEVGLLDALKLTADGKEIAPEGIEVEGAEVEGWLNDLFARLRDPDSTVALDEPGSLRADLRPYQERGFGWLAQMRRLGLGACLADDMGLGKTIQTIALWLHERERLNVSQPALLVCPTSVVGNWKHELSRFAPSLRVMKHHGPDRLKGADFGAALEKIDVVLTSYALIHRDLDTLAQVEWSTVVLDEAQNIKNPSTKQAQAVRRLPAGAKFALTGTPVENRLSELWSIMQFLNPGYLGSQRDFRATFSTPIERYGDENAAAALKQLVSPFILRRVKTDPNVIQDLPDKFENKVYCTLTPEQATLYEAVVREELDLLEDAEDDMARRGAVLRMLTRLKQICNHPAHFLKEGDGAKMDDRSGKLARLVEMIDEVRDVDERALIFTQYAEMGGLLQSYLREHLLDNVLFLHGGTPAQKREEMVRNFQSPHGPPVFILSLKAGGTGLNLTNANHVFHFDRWYNPAVENQATDRAFRIGQTKDVQVHKFICLGTLEERIDELIERKQALADQIVGAGESWIGEMDNNELRDLVTLRREMVEEVG
ncbi:MAG: DEAD/DEAH box helicase, partial [Anaerolineae bacterium]|nr:DEAD/DEAH box helicase [Anaerolineae bacterium]